MQLTLSNALAILALASSALASPVANVKRSIPALQGYSGTHFSGTEEYTTFCAPGDCCFPSASDAQGNPRPVVVNVQSLNLEDADVLLTSTSSVTIWDSFDCSGSPITTFNAFKGDANLGAPTVVGSFTFNS